MRACGSFLGWRVWVRAELWVCFNAEFTEGTEKAKDDGGWALMGGWDVGKFARQFIYFYAGGIYWV
jgi:hypothetical protein